MLYFVTLNKRLNLIEKKIRFLKIPNDDVISTPAAKLFLTSIENEKNIRLESKKLILRINN